MTGPLGEPTVWKFHLPWADVASVELPIGAKPLHVGLQPNLDGQGVLGGYSLQLWARVYPGADIEIRKFRIAGTGHMLKHPAIDTGEHIGSVIFPDGSLVFHVFEEALPF